jgi:hypothetical protein
MARWLPPRLVVNGNFLAACPGGRKDSGYRELVKAGHLPTQKLAFRFPSDQARDLQVIAARGSPVGSFAARPDRAPSPIPLDAVISVMQFALHVNSANDAP